VQTKFAHVFSTNVDVVSHHIQNAGTENLTSLADKCSLKLVAPYKIDVQCSTQTCVTLTMKVQEHLCVAWWGCSYALGDSVQHWNSPNAVVAHALDVPCLRNPRMAGKYGSNQWANLCGSGSLLHRIRAPG
jgi:hypothetical protein